MLLHASNGDSLVLQSGIWSPIDRAVTVASAPPGDVDEQVVPEVTEIRFISDATPGSDHFATLVAPGVVYIGGGLPPSLLGGNLTGMPALSTGRMSQSNINYPPALVAGNIYASITQQSAFIIGHSVTIFGNASLGNLILEINGVDIANIDLNANFNELNRPGSQNITNYNTPGTGSLIIAGVVTFVGGTLSILSIGTSGIPSNNYQQGTARITLAAAALRQGYNSIRLRHEYGAIINQTNLLGWFYDTNIAGVINDPTITSITITPNVPSLNYLSGVPYYGVGSTFDLDVTLLRLFNNVYHQSNIPLLLDASDFGDTTAGILVTDGSVIGVSVPPDITEIMTVNNFAITVGAGVEDDDPVVTGTPQDPYGSYTPRNTVSNGFAVMSEGPNSTDILDDFTDERYRLPNTTNFNVPIGGMPGPPGLFDSTILLTNVARANELQVYDINEATGKNRIVWPATDYSVGRLPVGPNYNGLVGTNRTYYRVFRSTVGSRTNGIITLPGLVEADIISNVGLRIKVPGKTMWLDLIVLFNGATFPTQALYPTGTNGEGCRINSGVNSLDINNQIEFSLGTIGTDASSDYQLILEITYANSGVAELLGTGAGLSINW